MNDYKPGNKIAFAFGAIGDIISYQTFTFLIFTFYYAVIGIDINMVTLGFIVWSLWNAINDPLAGFISDRTNTRWGRRVPFIVITFIPLALLMYLLWTPPFPESDPKTLSFIYFLLIIMIFDGVYTVNSLNLTSLFPEMYPNDKERASANKYRQVFIIFGLIFAFVAPTLFISDLSAKETDSATVVGQYQFVGALLAIVIFVVYLICIKWGIRERKDADTLGESALGVFEAFKITLGNRNFQWFLICNTFNWYVFGLIPTIQPIYGQFVLGIGTDESLFIGILLGLAFVVGGLMMPIWQFAYEKIDEVKKTWLISQSVWAISFIPFFFVTDKMMALIPFALLGIGLAGSLYFRDLIISDIVDEDALRTGVRREGAFYGVNALIMRLAVILTFLSINLVFNSVGWTVFTPDTVDVTTLTGIKMLMSLFPIAALILAILAFSRYNLVGDKLAAVKQKVHK